MGGKSSTTQSSSSVSIPPEVLAQYNAVNAQAETVAQTPFQQYSNGPNAFVAPLTATQQAGILGTNQYSNEAQPFYQTGSDMTQAAGDYTQNAMNATTGAMGLTQNAMGLTGNAMGMTQGALNPSYAQNAMGMTQANSGAANPQALAIGQYMNPYLQDVVAPTAALMQQQFGQAQSGQMGNAIQNGAFGGDRQQLAAANLQQQQGLAYGQTMGGLMNNAYTNALSTAQQQQGVNLSAQQQNLQRGLAGAQQYYGIGAQQQGLNLQQAGQYGSQAGQYGQQAGQYGQQAGQYGQLAGQYGSLGNQMGALGAGAQSAGLQGAQAQLAAGQAQQETEQAGLTALYNQFLQQQSYPFQTTQFLANIAEGTGALSGSTTSGSSTSPSSFFSDERLKEDIRDIGRTHDGQKIIEFRYKGEQGPKRIGLSAQDVEKHHPEAVGLAGGYRTVDYDKALEGAEREHHAYGGLAGGDVIRLKRDMGGGLSPNSAAAGGFSLDPSYLSAMQQAYASAPWGGSGAIVTGAPYGGKSHVPPSSGGGHGSLAVSKPPQAGKQEQSGLQQLSSAAGQIEKLGEQGQKAYNWGKSALGAGSPSPASSPTPSPSPTAAPTAAPTPEAGGGGGGGGAGSATVVSDAGLPDAGLGAGTDLASLSPDMGDLGAGLADIGGDLGDLSDLSLFAARGGSIRRGLAGGGSSIPQYGQPTDYTSNDEGDGGSIPFKSGTGAEGLNIPDERSNNKLAVADLPSSGGGGGGGSNPMSMISPLIGLAGLFLNKGGRVHRDAGGGLAPIEDMALPTLSDADHPEGLAPTAFAPSRDVTVRKAPVPEAGTLPPKADEYTAQAPPKPRKGGLAPVDYSSAGPDSIDHPTIRVPDEAPGLETSQKQGRDWLGENQDRWVPIAKGLGRGLLTALSSNSRYLGSALGQGLGAGLEEYGNAYEDTQNNMSNRGQIGAATVDQLQGARARQALTGQTQAETTGQKLANEATRQAQAHGDFFSVNGNDYVTIDDGQGHPKNVLHGQWLMAGMPPTYHQVHTAAGNAPQRKPNVPDLGLGGPQAQAPAAATGQPPGQLPGQPGQPAAAQSFGSVGPGGVQQAESDFRAMVVNPQQREQQKKISDAMEHGMAAAAQSSMSQKQLLTQAAQNLAGMTPGVAAPGALNAITAAAANKWNGVVDAFGGPSSLKVDPNNVASTINQEKLQTMMEFSRSHGSGQNSLGALEAAAGATPGAYMDPDTQKKVLASLYIDNQQDIDKWNYLNDYKKYVQSKHGEPFAHLYAAQNAMNTGWGNDHKQERYGPDERMLEGVLGAVDQNGVPLVTRLQKGVSPEQMKLIEQKYPGVRRYFGGGNG